MQRLFEIGVANLIKTKVPELGATNSDHYAEPV